jgi:hypothetical protein
MRLSGFLFFSYGEGVDLSLVFYVFSLEVCADPFADFGPGGWEKFDFLQFVISFCQNCFYLLEIFGMVGGDSYLATGFQAAEKILQISRTEKASFVVSFFRPGVGKINMEKIHGCFSDKIGKKNSGIGSNYSDILQAPSSDAIHGVTIVFACPFDAEKIIIRQSFGLVKKEGSFACTYLYVYGTGKSYKFG